MVVNSTLDFTLTKVCAFSLCGSVKPHRVPVGRKLVPTSWIYSMVAESRMQTCVIYHQKINFCGVAQGIRIPNPSHSVCVSRNAFLRQKKMALQVAVVLRSPLLGIPHFLAALDRD